MWESPTSLQTFLGAGDETEGGNEIWGPGGDDGGGKKEQKVIVGRTRRRAVQGVSTACTHVGL